MAYPRGHNISFYKLSKLLREAEREGILRRDRKKETRASYEWGIPIYRIVYIVKKRSF